MRILLSGATGFVGKALLRRLLRDDNDVVALGRRRSPDSRATSWIIRDSADLDADNAPGGNAFDVVFHFAAAGVAPSDRDLQRLMDVNISMGALILSKVEAGAFVFAGSSAEYAPKPTGNYTELDSLENHDLYGSSKAAGGIMHLATARSLSESFALLRFFHIFGPGESPHRLTTSLFQSLRNGHSVALSPGTQERDFVYLDDAIDAAITAANGLCSGRLPTDVYNICSGQAVSVKTVCHLAAEIIGANPSLLEFGAISMRENERQRFVGDGSTFHTQTGWKPKTSIREGLSRIATSTPYRA